MAMMGGGSVSVSNSVSATRLPSPSPSPSHTHFTSLSLRKVRRVRFCVANRQDGSSTENDSLQVSEEENKDPGVKVALSMIKFYKREISPLLPKSCRYVPTCSDYSMEAYTKYGTVKGSILTAWRICRCNPFGGYGFDPPRWFGEEREEPYSDL